MTRQVYSLTFVKALVLLSSWAVPSSHALVSIPRSTDLLPRQLRAHAGNAPIDIQLLARERFDLSEFELEYGYQIGAQELASLESTQIAAKKRGEGKLLTKDRSTIRATTGTRYPAMPHPLPTNSALDPESYFVQLREHLLSKNASSSRGVDFVSKIDLKFWPQVLENLRKGVEPNSQILNGSRRTYPQETIKRHNRKTILLDPRARSLRSADKIAFLFLTRGPMPLERVWIRFFGDASVRSRVCAMMATAHTATTAMH